MKITPYCRGVYYHETDRMDVVNHSNYIHWMEEARVDFMLKMGLPYEKMEEEGVMLPVLEINCNYKSSLRFGEHIAVITKIVEYNGFKLKLSYDIYNKKTKKLCAYGTSSHCFTDCQIKPIRIIKRHPNMHELFKNAMDIEYDFLD